MAWTAPRTWVTSENVTAALLNTHVRDNLNATAPGVATSAGGIIVTTGTNTVAQRTPAEASVATSETTTSTSYTDLTTSGPAVTVTTGTTALVFVTATIKTSNTSYAAAMEFAVSGATTRSAAAGDAEALYSQNTLFMRASAITLVTGLTAGSNTFTAKYRSTNASATATFSERRITVIPL